MANFKIFETPDEEFPIMILVMFCHSKPNQRTHINEALQEMKYEGWVLIDNLMQSGVEGLRFYRSYFKGEFIDDGFPVKIAPDSIYRKLSCDYLRENNLVNGSNLSDRKIKAIMNGEII